MSSFCFLSWHFFSLDFLAETVVIGVDLHLFTFDVVLNCWNQMILAAKIAEVNLCLANQTPKLINDYWATPCPLHKEFCK